MMRKIVFFQIFVLYVNIAILCNSAHSAPTEISVKSKVDKHSVYIGEDVRYIIKVVAEKSLDIKLPSLSDRLDGLNIKDSGRTESHWFKKKIRQWYIVNSYTPGKYTIPSLLVKYKSPDADTWNSISTKEIKIIVNSVLKGENNPIDIRDIKGPVSYPRGILFILILGLLFLILGALGIFLFRRKMHMQKESPPELQKTAWELAYERLDELKRKDLVSQGKVKEYYIELSDIVRHYLEDRFNLRAPEMTTEEFLGKVRKEKVLTYEHKSLLADFLAHCDLVKFARYGPEKKEIEASFESAKRLVDQTKIE